MGVIIGLAIFTAVMLLLLYVVISQRGSGGRYK